MSPRSNVQPNLPSSSLLKATSGVRKMRPKLTALAFAICVAAPSAFAGGYDMRNCALDNLTFIDPGSGGSFEVQRVGASYVYQCGDEFVDEPIAGELCRRLGETVLGGVLDAYGAIDSSPPEKAYAVFYVDAANPCCGWRLESERTLDKGQYVWLHGEDVPTLQSLGVASIDAKDRDEVRNAEGYVLQFGQEKHALVCRE